MEITRAGEKHTQEVAQKKTEQTSAARKAAKAEKVKTEKVGNSLVEALSTEKVQLSPDASLFTEGVEAARNSPDVRQEKVKQLKESIKNGSYKVDAKAVADRMIKESVEEAARSQES